MKRWATVFLFLLLPVITWAQPPVQTLVPQQHVAVGEAFQVQYVVYNLQGFQQLHTPDFGPYLKIVSGPAVYNGQVIIKGHPQKVQNYSYTLVPLRAGRLQVAGATVQYADGKGKAPEAFVVCLDKKAAAPAAGVKKMQTVAESDLLIKTEIGKRECYVGEPVTATFTLLSKVATAAEVIKNPGFYGFSVVEMPADQTTFEGSYTGGYEKHPLRKVQLYPMQSGQLVVDEMTVHNVVQHFDVRGNLVTEELILKSDPVTISVKPLPPATLPNFTGAVGQFSVSARLLQNELTVGRTGRLRVTLSGAGNFLQLTMPEIKWPAHLEGFAPAVTQQLYKEAVPMRGRKQYEYTFTADSTGAYTIPPVELTYFDPQTKKYRRAATDSLQVTVLPQKRLQTFFTDSRPADGPGAYFWLLLAGIAVGLLLLVFQIARKRKEKKLAPLIQRPLAAPDYAQQLQALRPVQKDLKAFYGQVQQIVLQYLKERYGIHPAPRESLQQQLARAPFGQPQKEALQQVLHECEQVQYYNAVPQIPFTELQQKAAAAIRQLQDGTTGQMDT